MIKYVYDGEHIDCFISCDHCHQRIDQASDGIAVFKQFNGDPETPPEIGVELFDLEPQESQAFHLHKPVCSEAFDARIASHEEHSLGEPLSVHLFRVLRSVKLDHQAFLDQRGEPEGRRD